VGGVSACVDIGLFMLFAKVLGLPYLRVAVGTFILATLVNYLLSVIPTPQGAQGVTPPSVNDPTSQSAPGVTLEAPAGATLQP